VSPQFLAELLVVVDAAVEDQGEPELLVGHRLGAGLGQVDDLEPAVAERDRPAGEEALAVRTAGLQTRQHCADGLAVRGPVVEPQLAGDSAHD
jgi:hypothetical protein